MRSGLLVPFLTGAIVLASVPANAQSGPPIVVSPDLNAPWVLQFEGVQQARPRVTRPPVRKQVGTVRRRPAQPIVRSRQSTPSVTRPAPDGIDPRFLPQTVSYDAGYKAGTIVIDTTARYLYLVQSDGKARRYGVGVGKPGFEWAGNHKVTRKAEWPSWRPPTEMIARERLKGRELPAYMPGGPANPLGARALYLGSTLYRIHGTNQPWSIGLAVSSGCIRMRNVDVTDLYERVGVGTRVVVL